MICCNPWSGPRFTEVVQPDLSVPPSSAQAGGPLRPRLSAEAVGVVPSHSPLATNCPRASDSAACVASLLRRRASRLAGQKVWLNCASKSTMCCR